LPSSHPAGQLACVSHDEGPLQLTEQEQARSQVTPEVHVFCPEQVTVQGVPSPHSMGPVQALFALHSTVQAVASPQCTPPAHSPSAEQRTRQGTPAGQSTRASQPSPLSWQSIAQVSPSQVPIPAHAVAQSMKLSPASGSDAASGAPPSYLASDASIRAGPESRPPPPAPELSNPHDVPARQASASQALAVVDPMLLQGRRSPACKVG
jgi:hypothetical protein